MERISYESTEPIAIRGIKTDVDPTSSTVKCNLVVSGTDVPATSGSGWITGAWRTTALQADGRYMTDAWFTIPKNTYARDTIYDVYWWVDGVTYDPVRLAGSVSFY